MEANTIEKRIIVYAIYFKLISDMYVYYNKFKGIYEAVSRADALKDEGFGMIIIPTPCQP